MYGSEGANNQQVTCGTAGKIMKGTADDAVILPYRLYAPKAVHERGSPGQFRTECFGQGGGRYVTVRNRKKIDVANILFQLPRYSPTYGESRRWLYVHVTWTPPATDVGHLIFYAAGNAANGDGNLTGDRIYTTVNTITPNRPCMLTQKPTIRDVQNAGSFVSAIGPGAQISVFGTGFQSGAQVIQPLGLTW